MTENPHRMLVTLLAGILAAQFLSGAQDSLPPVIDGKVPLNLEELWGGYDPRKEPLDIETLKSWEQDGVACRVVRYQVGVFKGSAAKVAGFYAYPNGGSKLPAILEIHGGGQAASFDSVLTFAKRGYAAISINWGGNKLNFGRSPVSYDGPQTDWGKLDATHPPQRNPVNHFAGSLAPDDFTVDPVESPRNSNWFIVLIAARRAITFLEQQPEVDATRIAVCGHSMGGKLTTDLAGIDPRVKAAVPSCGGAGNLPGTDLTNMRALELACISDNAYIPRITCPILWLSPTNDFNAPIDTMAGNWRDLPDDRVRFSISPHLNHRHADEHAITGYLWLEQHLRAAFTMPRTPQLAINLKTPDGVPMVIVIPDRSMPIKRVDIYYSIDPHPLTRFWRDAPGENDANRWQAKCPVMNTDAAVIAYANVIYETPARYRHVAQPPGQDDTDTFAISSRVTVATAAQLRAAGVKATDQPDPMIDDGSRGWHDWYRLNWGHPPLWTATTRKLIDPKWRGPDGAKLVFEIKSGSENTLVIMANTNAWGVFSPGKPAVDYTAVKHLTASPDWQTVTVSLDELISTDPKVSAPLANWQSVCELSISPSGEAMKDGHPLKVDGHPWQGPREIRKLRWVKAGD